MNRTRVVLARSPVLRTLFAIQDARKIQNKELTQRAHVARNLITNIRRGRQIAPLDVIERVADVLGCVITVQERIES